MANKPYERITFRGKTLNRRTVAAILQAEDVLLGGRDSVILQGSYHGGVSASAGTHDGGGAVDLAWPGNSRTKANELVKAFRQVGFAIWVRDDLPGVWSHHIHGILIGDKEMSSGAQRQVQEYYARQDGLAGWHVDKAWRPAVIPVFSYPLPTMNVWVARQQAKAKVKTSKPSVKLIQRALNAKSGLHLATDGIFGKQTRAALAHYEKTHGGDGDGIPGLPSQRILGLARFHAIDEPRK